MYVKLSRKELEKAVIDKYKIPKRDTYKLKKPDRLSDRDLQILLNPSTIKMSELKNEVSHFSDLDRRLLSGLTKDELMRLFLEHTIYVSGYSKKVNRKDCKDLNDDYHRVCPNNVIPCSQDMNEEQLYKNREKFRRCKNTRINFTRECCGKKCDIGHYVSINMMKNEYNKCDKYIKNM